ncbi:MAG TPA: hypothetical protein VKE74_23855 [Gemmataceae bacterium]|nr:hypothetical protein [Gemmataceae bacterium]
MCARPWPALVVVLFALGLAGCGGPATRVSGRVTCGGKPVRGSILFSPLGEGPNNTGPSVAAPLNDDGTFELELKTVGKHRVVVSPADVVYPAKPGQEYPCDLAPAERELKAGGNEVVIELQDRGRK